MGIEGLPNAGKIWKKEDSIFDTTQNIDMKLFLTTISQEVLMNLICNNVFRDYIYKISTTSLRG